MEAGGLGHQLQVNVRVRVKVRFRYVCTIAYIVHINIY